MTIEIEVSVKNYDDRKALIEAEINSSSTKEGTVLFRGKNTNRPIIRVPINIPLYRMSNGRTQVEQMQYIEDKKLPIDFFSKGQENLSAQKAQHRILLNLSKDSKAPIYEELERVADQRKELIITEPGVVLDGNRRLAAMRDLFYKDAKTYNSFGYVDAIVLPEEANEKDLELLEAELQMAPEYKLDYGWIERRLKIRHHNNDLKIPRKVIKETYRFLREDDINKEIQQLELAEEFLEFYLRKPRAYREVAKNEQLFKDLQLALAEKSGSEAEIRRCFGFILAKEAGNLGNRVYSYNPIFGKEFQKVVSQFATEIGIQLGPQENSDSSTEFNDDDPLGGLGREGQIDYEPLKKRLMDTAQSGGNVDIITRVYESIKNEKKEENVKLKALKNTQSANRLLQEIDLSISDPEHFVDMIAQLDSIIESANKIKADISKMERT